MSLRLFFAPLILMPFYCFSQPVTYDNNTTLVKSFSNENEQQDNFKNMTRTIEFPTQIIRIGGSLEGQELHCDQVNNRIEEILVKPITKDKFIYNTYIYCRYNPETTYAIEFAIQSIFDPVSDVAIDYLKVFLAENNGTDLLGTPINIESAKGLIVALTIAAGMKKNPNTPPFIEYRKDRANFYFTNHYEMRNKLFLDVYQNFFSDDPNKILPFLDKWVFANAGLVYKNILRDSNYVELQPERIFLMDQGEKIFVSKLKYYFRHPCNEYENHRCLHYE